MIQDGRMIKSEGAESLLDENRVLRAELAEQQQKNKILADRYSLMETILESLDDMVSVSHIQSNEIYYQNKSHRKISPQSANSNSDYQYLLDKNQRPAGVFTSEFCHTAENRWFEVINRAIEWRNEQFARLEVSKDITKQKQIIQLLEQSKDQAEEASKLKDQYMALVAHDLKSPLTTILAVIRRIFEKEENLHESHKMLLKNVLESGDQLVRMMDELFNMSRVNSGTRPR